MKKLLLLFAITAMSSCSKQDPEPGIQLENSRWSRFDHEQPGAGKVFQVIEFNSNGIGRTDYRVEKVGLSTPIIEFQYRYNQQSVWLSVDKGPADRYVQEGRFTDGCILLGGDLYYREN